MQDYSKLKVWQNAHALTLDIYKTTKRFPDEERYGLTSQLRRCSASIGANIAEGCGREGNRELHRFLQIASGSASELSYHLLLAKDLGYIPETQFQVLRDASVAVHKMLSGLIASVHKE